MIRINLLAGAEGRKTKGQADVHLEAIAAAACVVLTVAGCMVYSGMLDSDLEARHLDMKDKKKQIAELKKQVKTVEDFEKKKAQLEARNRIIQQLEKRRGGPVRFLDSVSRSLEPLKLWVLGLTLKGGRIVIDGMALTNDDVVAFVNNLRRGDLFKNINLKEIRSKQQAKIKVLKFRIEMSLKG